MTNTNRERGEMMEQFAEMEHTRWAKWQSYLHSKCTKNADGSLTIPVESVIHWERQIGTPYSQLTEREKESDRNEARPYLEVFAQALKDAREEGSKSRDAELVIMMDECQKKGWDFNRFITTFAALVSSPDNQPK